MRKANVHFFVSFCVAIFLTPVTVFSEGVTRAEYEALLERVTKLEAVLGTLQIEVENELYTSSHEPQKKSVQAKKTLLDSVVSVIQAREDSTTYPWMEISLWDSLHPGMSPKEILSILGQPTLDEPSLHKRIDTVYTYKGKQSSTGNHIKGIIRFYRNRLVEIEPPEIQ